MTQSPRRRSWRERLGPGLTARAGSAPASRSTAWRAAAPAMALVAGVLFVTSAVSSGGTDLRAGRYDDLGDVASAEAQKLEELRAEQEQIAAQVDQLTEDLASVGGGTLQEEVDVTEGPAGLEPVSGPGVTITLTDAPEAVQDTAEVEDLNSLVVHEQDIQAVVNALWAGGAEAMTIQGQRVVSTTGIRCVGNTVILHDVPYAPPYVISAIGPTEEMLASVNESPYIAFYLEVVEAYQLGWDVQIEPEISAPGYTGSTELDYARPAGGEVSADDRT
jgi:uncharacterized protein YlxW (UPF0749 family)